MVLILNYMSSDNTVYYPRFLHAGKFHFSFEAVFQKNQSFLKDVNGDRAREETKAGKKLK